MPTQKPTWEEKIDKLADDTCEWEYGLSEDDWNKVKEIFRQELQQERERCKRIYVEYVDWDEWAISDEEASENFEQHYKEILEEQ